MTTHTCLAEPETGSAPAELLPALPYLVGFHPADSLVAVFLNLRKEICLTARLDWSVCLADPVEAANALLGPAAHCEASHVLLVAVDIADGAMADLVEIACRFLEADLSVVWCGTLTGPEYLGLDCPAAGCDGHVLDPLRPSATTTHLVAEGHAPLRDRDAVLAEVAARDGVPVAARRLTRGPDRECDRDVLLEQVTDVLTAADDDFAAALLPDADLATVALACNDVPVRDVLLVRLSDPGAAAVSWTAAWPVLHATLRRCPPEHLPGVATMAALAAWQCGDGVRARACLERALDADPRHRLAVLSWQMLQAALPPHRWREAMADLDETTARNRGGGW